MIHEGSTAFRLNAHLPAPTNALQLLQDELSESRRQFQSVLDSLSGLFYRSELSAPWRTSFVSNGVRQLTGYTAEDLGAKDGWSSIMRAEDRSRVETVVTTAITSRRPFEVSYRITTREGEIRWVSERGHAVYEIGGEPLFLEGIISDISGRKEADELQRTMMLRWKHTLDAIPQMVWTMAGDGTDEYYNAQWAHFTGVSLGIGGDMRRQDLIHPDDQARVQTLWAEKFRSGAPYEAQYRIKHVSGEFRWILSRGECERDSKGRQIRWYGTCTDIHDEVLGRQAANHDVLTQLPNRALFQCALDESIEAGRRRGTVTTVLVMDLDDFKRTNDALGHDAGDALLVGFASRLRGAVRKDDMVARLGGDEFAVILNGVGTKEDVEAVTESIFASLKVPCAFEGKLLDISTSVGAATYPGHGKSRSELMKHADIALYAAKASGRGTLRIFQSSMRVLAQKRLSMLELARDALRGDRIIAHYQPKIDLRSGRLDGFEALLRWEHPRKGLQSPETINAAFQDGVLAAKISDRILQCVVTDMQRWKEAGVCFGHIAVNAGAAEFKDGKFAEKLLGRLKQAGLSASSLQLEVTETVFLGRGGEYVEETLRMLSHEGIQIALDDFGTGYASLSHLNKFPVNVIKIDRSFIDKLETSEHDAAIVRAVIKLGRSLNIKIVAEGIETLHQAEFLKRQRCDLGQGFFFGKAVAAERIPALIKNWGRTSGGR